MLKQGLGLSRQTVLPCGSAQRSDGGRGERRRWGARGTQGALPPLNAYSSAQAPSKSLTPWQGGGRRAPRARASVLGVWGCSRGAPDVSPSTRTLAGLLETLAQGKINLIVRNTCLGSDQISFFSGPNYSELISNQLPLGYKSPP